MLFHALIVPLCHKIFECTYYFASYNCSACFNCGKKMPSYEALRGHLWVVHHIRGTRSTMKECVKADEANRYRQVIQEGRRESSAEEESSRLRSGLRRVPSSCCVSGSRRGSRAQTTPGTSTHKGEGAQEPERRRGSSPVMDPCQVSGSRPPLGGVAASGGPTPVPPLPWYYPPGQQPEVMPPSPWNQPEGRWVFDQEVRELPGGIRKWTSSWTFIPTETPELGRSPRITLE